MGDDGSTMIPGEPVQLWGKAKVELQDVRSLHPRHGPHASVGGSPERRVNSIRRTSSVDTHRPHGLSGYTIQKGRARDFLTTSEGSTVLSEETLLIQMEYTSGPIITLAESSPVVEGLDALIGTPASTGLRQRIVDNVQAERGGPLFLLLDEIPAATLVSGHALGHAARRGDLEFPDDKRGPTLQFVDLCAGFTADGTILQEAERTGNSPIVTGPEAPAVVDEDDLEGWHDLDSLDTDSMRRLRRMDVTRVGENLQIDVFFRDSHMNPWGVEQVVHEYGVTATVNETTMTITAARAEDHSLPWQECPRAAASASRLVGLPLSGLRTLIREEFVGPTTCTHLNDTMRSLEDVAYLASKIPQ